MRATRQQVMVDLRAAEYVLDDRDKLVAIGRAACLAAGATIIDEMSHQFEPFGVTVLFLLAESHASLHTWPEEGRAYMDVFTCGDVDPAEIARQWCDELVAVVDKWVLIDGTLSV